MSVYATNQIIPLIGAVLYTLLLLTPLARRGQKVALRQWLVGVIAASIVWELSLFIGPLEAYPNLSVALLLLGTATAVGITATFLEWKIRRSLLMVSVTAVLLTIAVAILTPTRQVELNNFSTTTGTILTYLVWFAINGLLLGKTWREYKKASQSPWHANRLLYWFMVLAAVFLGELLQFFDNLTLIIIGQTLRFFGVVGMAHGIASFRIFDVRTRALRTLAIIIINLISALPLIIAVLATLQLSREWGLDEVVTAALLTLILTLSFFLYQPYRRLVEKITFRYLRGEGLNTNQIMRNYSQAISRTLDVQQLALLIAGTLSELLETNRGALMLLTRLENGAYEVEPITGMGQISRRKFTLTPDNLFISTLIHQNQPLLQYDLDFSPEFRALDQHDHAWLKEQQMEVYVPVGSGEELESMIAVGPKTSALPYQPGELELMQILADQTVVALQNARLYSELNGQNERIRHLNIDLTEQNERLEIMDRVKTDFITIASHELRTPLTQVKGYSDILAAMNDENALTREQTREIIGHINRATLQLESLISAMLDASQLDVDGMQLTFVKTRIDTIVRLAMEPMAQALRERRIQLATDGIHELPPIYADFKRLVQSFTNLLGNAVKYTPDNGRIHVTAAALTSTENDEYVEITISDTGIGIDPKYHQLIFEKFFRIGDPQLHSTGSTKFKGAGPGLGLPIAKGVIEAHGGRIWVESEGEDEQRLPGSRFHIILPVKPPGVQIKEGTETAVRPAYLVG
jgi:signal transduction histidine kinase